MTADHLCALDVAHPDFSYHQADLVRECVDELDRRRDVYPRLIRAGKLLRTDARTQMSRMRGAATRIELKESDVALADCIAEVKRELAMRERLYPRQVAANRMTEHTAFHRYAKMKRVLYALLAMQPEADQPPITQPSLFA